MLDMNVVNQHIGRRIEQQRKARGLTQQELAHAAGMNHYQQIHNYESGLTGMPASVLQRLAVALDVSIDYFYQGISSFTENPEKADVAELGALCEQLGAAAWHKVRISTIEDPHDRSAV